MSNYGEGVIEIPLEEFWDFVSKYCDNERSNIFLGVPKVNYDNYVIEIDYIFNSKYDPQSTVDFKESKCYKQWELLKKETE